MFGNVCLSIYKIFYSIFINKKKLILFFLCNMSIKVGFHKGPVKLWRKIQKKEDKKDSGKSKWGGG